MTRNLADTVIQILWPAVGLVSRLLPTRFNRWLREEPEEPIVA